MEDEEDLPTEVTYFKREGNFRFEYFSDWSQDLWERLLGRLATEEEEAIENERYMRKPNGRK